MPVLAEAIEVARRVQVRMSSCVVAHAAAVPALPLGDRLGTKTNETTQDVSPPLLDALAPRHFSRLARVGHLVDCGFFDRDDRMVVLRIPGACLHSVFGPRFVGQPR